MKNLFRRFQFWYAARQRRIDIQILWPACKQQTSHLIHARDAFREHAFNDDAWMCLGMGEVDRLIDELQ